MAIIYITPQTTIDHEASFHDPYEPGRTVINLVALKTARSVLGISQPIAVKAIYSERSATYAFVYNGHAYRAMFPLVVPCGDDHFRTCKTCRDGVWCETGERMIQATVGGA